MVELSDEFAVRTLFRDPNGVLVGKLAQPGSEPQTDGIAVATQLLCFIGLAFELGCGAVLTAGRLDHLRPYRPRSGEAQHECCGDQQHHENNGDPHHVSAAGKDLVDLAKDPTEGPAEGTHSIAQPGEHPAERLG